MYRLRPGSQVGVCVRQRRGQLSGVASFTVGDKPSQESGGLWAALSHATWCWQPYWKHSMFTAQRYGGNSPSPRTSSLAREKGSLVAASLRM